MSSSESITNQYNPLKRNEIKAMISLETVDLMTTNFILLIFVKFILVQP